MDDKFLRHVLRAFLKNSSDLVFIKDLDLRYLGASETFAKLANKKDSSHLVGKFDHEIFNEELATKYTRDDRKILNEGIALVDYIEPLPAPDGRNRYSSTSKFPIYDDDNNIIALYGIARDVTEKIELEEERESRELTQQLFEDILEADITENKMLRVTGSVIAQSLGLSQDSKFTETVVEVANKFIHKDYREEFISLYNAERLVEDYKNGDQEFSHISYQTNNGTNYKWVEFSSKIYFSRISKTLRITTFIRDLDSEIRSKATLRQKAETDALTGLLNRENILEQINECITGYGSNQSHALLFIDLDHFKDINDTMGHLFGDKILRQMAEKINAVFGEQNIVGRVGGDEFLVLLRNITDYHEVEEMAKEVFKSIAFYHFENNNELCVTCSVGIAICEKNNKTVHELYDQADQAMYKAKESGRNKVELN